MKKISAITMSVRMASRSPRTARAAITKTTAEKR